MMALLLAGIALWWAAHLFKRLAPGVRARFGGRRPKGGKGVLAAALVVALVMIVIGYRGTDFVPVYEPPSWGRHLNNLLMLLAVALFGLGSSKSRLRRRLRHPMLLGVLTWSAAHLLVNGDLSSLLLFGLMGLWAVLEIVLINRAEPAPARFAGGSVKGDIRLAVITLIIYAVIAAIHTWLGYWPFPG